MPENGNEAKKTLAYEVTKLIHGEQEAEKARGAAESLFGGGANFDDVPTTGINQAQLTGGIELLEVLQQAKLINSRGEGRRLINQGGVSLNGKKVTEEFLKITEEDFPEGKLMIKKGKKIFHQIVIE